MVEDNETVRQFLSNLSDLQRAACEMTIAERFLKVQQSPEDYAHAPGYGESYEQYRLIHINNMAAADDTLAFLDKLVAEKSPAGREAAARGRSMHSWDSSR